MNEDERVELFGAVLSLLYEFNWPMTETEMMKHTMTSSKVEDLRSVLGDLKKAELITDAVPGNWKLTKKGRAMVRQSLGRSS
jgi:predicted transcriptional regulator